MIKSSGVEELLGVTVDSNLNFKEHVVFLCSEENCKLHALSRVSKCMSLNKRRILMKYFIILQLNYCPLIWIIHNRGLNNKINHIHERALRIVYDGYSSTFEDLLNKYKSVTIHQRNQQLEVFKVKIGRSPIIMNEILTFLKNNTYNLKSGKHLAG